MRKYVFYYDPRLLKYTFGQGHPYNSKRLKKAIDLLESWGAIEITDPGVGNDKEVLAVHSVPYMKALKEVSANPENAQNHAFGLHGDTPPYEGIYEAARDVLHASRMAASAINDGYDLAFNLAGGLHHAQIENASGFCALSDIAAAIDILKRKHKYIAYVDIDVHHGDGPQAIYANDPDVLTVSIHQYGFGFYPGTGSVDESSATQSIINVPLTPGTNGKDWLRAVKEVVLPALVEFDPQVIVLQLGADAHYRDPLGGLFVTIPQWLDAVRAIRDLGKPILALGGGGYDIDNTANMFAAATVELIGSGIPVDKLNHTTKFDLLDDHDTKQGPPDVERQQDFLSDLERLKTIVYELGEEEVDDYS